MRLETPEGLKPFTFIKTCIDVEKTSKYIFCFEVVHFTDKDTFNIMINV